MDRKLKRDEGIRQARQKNDEFLQYLSWLWENCMKQILEGVRGMQPTGQDSDVPRVWWIGTGLASSMPFHAAGHHLANPNGAGSNDNAYSMAVSSYVPSIKALAHARSRARRAERTVGSLLIATMPTTPGLLALRDVEKEKDYVQGAAGRLLPMTVLRHPSVHQVVDSLREALYMDSHAANSKE